MYEERRGGFLEVLRQWNLSIKCRKTTGIAVCHNWLDSINRFMPNCMHEGKGINIAMQTSNRLGRNLIRTYLKASNGLPWEHTYKRNSTGFPLLNYK